MGGEEGACPGETREMPPCYTGLSHLFSGLPRRAVILAFGILVPGMELVLKQVLKPNVASRT